MSMKKKNISIIALFLIIIFAAILRLINMPSIPPSLSWDEVSLGYNAYSIAKTGHDEHGKLFPLSVFESYGDYKPPGYIYADVPFVYFLGLTEFAVRLPSVIAGIVSVILTYFLVKELFRRASSQYRELLALLSALLLAVSPWHLNISRVAYEANLAHVLTIGAILLFIKSLNSNPKLLIPSGVLFALSLYTFNSSRIFVPVFVFFLALFYWGKLWSVRRWVISAGMISFVVLLPLIPHLLSKEGKLRFQEVNIFSDVKVVETANRRIETSGNTILAKFLQNRRVQFAQEMARHYFDNLSPNFLFINGDGNPKFSIRDVGQLYVVEIPFLILGFYFLIKRKEADARILIMWLLVGILPASIARETPHALRTLNSLPVWQILVVVGFVAFFIDEKKERLFVRHRILFGITVAVFILNALYYLHTYHTTYATEFASEWQYGYREAIQKAEKLKDQYNGVWITDTIGRPYMYTLFYTKYDPYKFQTNVNRTSDAFGFFTVHSFDKYFFDPIPYSSSQKILYIDAPENASKYGRTIELIKLPNGNPVLGLYE